MTLTRERKKVNKARSGYDTSFPLILSVYCNEYEAILLTQQELKQMVINNKNIFNNLTPFSEILFWGAIPGDFLVQ